MTWIELHTASEKAALEAEEASRGGNLAQAKLLYEKAADFEQQALAEVDGEKTRTRGITAISAVALWYKAAALDRAEQLAHSLLADRSIPAFVRTDLQSLVQAIWTEISKKKANVSFLPGQVLVSVKGGEIIPGGAPLDLIVEKVQTIQAMFYRTIEFIKDLPLRLHGAPDREIQESCRPWLFQAAPGSYQFSVAIQEPLQRDFFKDDMPPDMVARQFLQILEAAASENEKNLETVVPKPNYRNVFLKLSRNLAPTGKTFSSIEFHTPAGEHPIALTPENRASMNQTLRKTRLVEPPGSVSTEEELIGILRAVDLNKDFLDVTIDSESVHVLDLVDAMDDLIGPMVNKRVKVHVTRQVTGQLRFRDIELED